MTKEYAVLKGVLITDIDLYQLDTSLDEAIKYLESFKEQYPEYSNLKLDVSVYYENTHINLHGDRLETDEEYAARIKQEEKFEKLKNKRKISKEEKERKEYERLKKKFG